MNRFRFRAWHRKKQAMGLVKTILFLDDQRGCVFADWPGNSVGLFGSDDCDQCVLMHSTGLKDRKGIEVFEKDIIVTDYSRTHETPFAYKVEWCDEAGQWLFDPFLIGDEDGPLLGIEEFAQSWEEVQDCEVIGNLYQHPHLLHP